MLLSAVQPLTLLDYPGKVAAIAFLPGCNFRCRFCHNPEFVLPERIATIQKDFIAESVFFRFLEKRRGLLDGIVISGGEPTIHQDLPDFIRKIRSFGFLVKLDTNGTHPDMLAFLYNEWLLDFVAMDIKHAPEKYHSITGWKGNIADIHRSIKLILESKVPSEFRSTIIDGVHTREDILAMAHMIRGAQHYVLQNFRPEHILDDQLSGSSFHPDQMKLFCEDISSFVKTSSWRG